MAKPHRPWRTEGMSSKKPNTHSVVLFPHLHPFTMLASDAASGGGVPPTVPLSSSCSYSVPSACPGNIIISSGIYPRIDGGVATHTVEHCGGKRMPPTVKASVRELTTPAGRRRRNRRRRETRTRAISRRGRRRDATRTESDTGRYPCY